MLRIAAWYYAGLPSSYCRGLGDVKINVLKNVLRRSKKLKLRRRIAIDLQWNDTVLTLRRKTSQDNHL